MLQQYLQKQEYFIDHISFRRNQNYYHGNGIMLWNPNEGFRIMASIRREGVIFNNEEIEVSLRTLHYYPFIEVAFQVRYDYS